MYKNNRRPAVTFKRCLHPIKSVRIFAVAIILLLLLSLKKLTRKSPQTILPMEALRQGMEAKRVSKLSHRPHVLRLSNPKQQPILITCANYKGFNLFAHFCETIHTAIHAGWEVHVLGWAALHIFPSRAKFAKIPTLIPFLKTLPPDQIFLFMDAYDVLVMGGPEEAKQKFLQASSAYQADIIIGAEKNCYPFTLDPKYRHYLCHENYPQAIPVNNPWRYLNAGVWMGYADTAIQFLEGMMMIDKLPGLVRTDGDDQAHFHYAFMSGKYSISLDYNNSLFAAMGSLKKDLVFDYKLRRWRSQRFGTFPVTLHFNGNKSAYFDFGNPLFSIIGEIGNYNNITGAALESVHGVNFDRVCKKGWIV